MHGPDTLYALIMLAAVATGAVLFWRRRQPTGLSPWQLAGVGLGAFCGGMIGAKLPFVLADLQGLLHGTAWFDDGKTIMAGLLGGYLGARLAEWWMGVRLAGCDSFATPVAAAVGVGRLACFHAGCCFGQPTALPWGIDFGDGVLRHPTQLYESAFHLTAAVVLDVCFRRGWFQGQLLRLYFTGYFVFRFFTEFLRPEPPLWLGLTGYQWAALVLIPALGLRRSPVCCPPAPRGSAPRRAPRPSPADGVLRPAQTVCPVCLASLTGQIVVRGGRVFLERTCPEHGPATALVASDRRHYYLAEEVSHVHALPLVSPCCGPGHRTCVALLEITGACNLHCPVCFADSPAGGHRPFDALAADLEGFLARRGPLDILQLSGGEPLLHPGVLALIDRAHALPVGHVMINTNGLELLRRPELAAELARRRPKLELNLQFDGFEPATYRALRGEDLARTKQHILATIREHDLPVTLVATVARGVNEHELGAMVRFGLKTPQIRGITFQPATWAGRFEPEASPLDRVTLADVVRLLAEQCPELLTESDIEPLPCSHPNCCGIGYLARPRGRRPRSLTHWLRVPEVRERLTDRVNFTLADAQACCGTARRPEDFFRITVKPFMDAATFDRDRIDACCIHIIRPGGGAVSFCRHNILERGRTAGMVPASQVIGP